MKNVEPTPFHSIGHDIGVALDNGAPMGAVILTYAAIDAMAFYSMPDTQTEVARKDLIGWVEKYLRADSSQPYQYEGIDVYGARCGLLHRYGATSNISDKGDCKIFGYHDGSEHKYNSPIDDTLVLISMKRFVNDFFCAMKRFLGDVVDIFIRRLVYSNRKGGNNEIQNCYWAGGPTSYYQLRLQTRNREGDRSY